MESLDEIDRRLLALLQAEGRLTGAELGRRVGLSQPAAAARVQRLEKTGVITGYRAGVDPAKLGLNINAHLRLRTTHAQLQQVLALASRLPEITTIRRVTGDDCLLFDVQCADACRLEAVVDSDRPGGRRAGPSPGTARSPPPSSCTSTHPARWSRPTSST